ncbi:hypothetical protein BGW36DRAFT_373621 [Talaromyces proteolyticus]|uniref:BZIP domain-containing protein n=1 Tax=Talaromyces proteolyticus TaxID=1131652 RepID=A0AAD4Q2C9_9EURO|nr:uncharacterized protein BGW36DRAFT_373621 [Talaromyces proteolyticus]KAH8700193.1 hypothetical protein BGW36DRAFT_373621 [Talaromyces proteolyticus]
MTPGLLQPPGQTQLDSQTPLIAMDSLSRTPSRMGSSRYGDDQVSLPGPPEMLSQNGPMIPVTIDLKSGSRSQAEKRKANSDASRRFRNRKKNEAVLEQRISQLMEQLQSVTEQRDFYRSERDFFRDNLGRHVGSGQIPPRPASPRNYRAGLGQTGGNTIKMERMSKSAGASPSLVPLQTQPPSLPMPLPQSAQNSPYASPTVSQHRSYSSAWPSGPGASGESGASAHGQYRPADIGYVNTWSRP